MLPWGRTCVGGLGWGVVGEVRTGQAEAVEIEGLALVARYHAALCAEGGVRGETPSSRAFRVG